MRGVVSLEGARHGVLARPSLAGGDDLIRVFCGADPLCEAAGVLGVVVTTRCEITGVLLLLMLDSVGGVAALIAGVGPQTDILGEPLRDLMDKFIKFLGPPWDYFCWRELSLGRVQIFEKVTYQPGAQRSMLFEKSTFVGTGELRMVPSPGRKQADAAPLSNQLPLPPQSSLSVAPKQKLVPGIAKPLPLSHKGSNSLPRPLPPELAV